MLLGEVCEGDAFLRCTPHLVRDKCFSSSHENSEHSVDGGWDGENQSTILAAPAHRSAGQLVGLSACHLVSMVHQLLAATRPNLSKSYPPFHCANSQHLTVLDVAASFFEKLDSGPLQL
jgi:hypothetical protein